MIHDYLDAQLLDSMIETLCDNYTFQVDELVYRVYNYVLIDDRVDHI